MESNPKGEQENQQHSTQEHEVVPSRFLHRNRRRNSPKTWSRCFVYDSESGKVDVRSTDDVKEDNKYQKIPLRPRQKHVELFLNEDSQASEKRFKTEEEAKKDQYPVLFSKLDLRGPGVWNKVLLMSGSLSTLYVSSGDANKDAAGYTSSLVSSIHD